MSVDLRTPPALGGKFLEPPTGLGLLLDPQALGVGTALGDFRLLEVCGQGSGGIVYRAQQLSLAREVALKVLVPHPLAREAQHRRFLREARAAARLQHPHVVRVLQVGEADGLGFLAMELARGGSLAERLQAGPIPIDAALDWLEQIASAVAHAHAAGILHRDLKPSNVLLDEDSRALVADFGLARELGGDLQASSLGIPVGTPRYMSPEQRDPSRCDQLDARTDVYALGVLLAELTGADASGERLVLETWREPLPGLRALVTRCLAADPAERPASAQALLRELRRIRRAASRPAPRLRRGLAWAFGLGLIGVLGSFSFWSAAGQRSETAEAQAWPAHRQAWWQRAATTASGLAPVVPARLHALPSAAGRLTLRSAAGFVELDRGAHEAVGPPPGTIALRPATPAAPAGYLRVSGAQAATAGLPPFDIAARAVSNLDYLVFLLGEAHVRAPAAWRELLPISWRWQPWPRWWRLAVVGVRPRAARAYAEARGMRLPSHAEWTLARQLAGPALAPGDPAWTQAWAGWSASWQLADDLPARLRESARARRLWPELTHQATASFQLAGLREWTCSWDLGATGDHLLAGSAWHDRPREHALSPQRMHPLLPPGSERSAPDIGFRCARSVRPASGTEALSPHD